MNTVSDVRPVWTNRPSVYAVWAATGETPEWIAARTEALLQHLHAAFEVTFWITHEDRPWAGSIEELSDFVRRSVVRDRPTAADPAGEAIPLEGYLFFVSGKGPKVGLQIRVAAGAAIVGRKLPAHTLLIQLEESVPGGVTSRSGYAVCEALARTWEPLMLVLSDDPVRQIARRGNWKIGVGYRTWIRSAVGAVSQVADGLTTTELAGGTMISAPDDWPAQRVVDAMMKTLTANGLDEVPH